MNGLEPTPPPSAPLWHTPQLKNATLLQLMLRNNLNKIFGAPLNLDDSWAVDGCLHDGTLYLDIVKGEEKEFPDSDRFMYYGYKFESLCTGEQPAFGLGVVCIDAG
jgi:hypothetical protein